MALGNVPRGSAQGPAPPGSEGLRETAFFFYFKRTSLCLNGFSEPAVLWPEHCAPQTARAGAAERGGWKKKP